MPQDYLPLYLLLQFLNLICVLNILRIRLLNHDSRWIHIFSLEPIRELGIGREVLE